MRRVRMTFFNPLINRFLVLLPNGRENFRMQPSLQALAQSRPDRDFRAVDFFARKSAFQGNRAGFADQPNQPAKQRNKQKGRGDQQNERQNPIEKRGGSR